MGVSSQSGSLGFALQASKGLAVAPAKWIKTTEITLNPEQDPQPLPPEIGGQRGTTGVTKLGIRATGGFTTIVRAKYIPWFLYGLCGTKAVTGTGSASYKHTITPSDTEIWMTLEKNVSDVWTDRFVDCKIGSMTWDVPARGYGTMAFGVSGITPSVVSNPTENAWDTTPQLVSGAGTVTIGGVAFKATRIQVAIDNGPDNAQWIIGQYVLDDIDFMQQAVTVTFDKHIQDSTLYKAIYYNAGTTFDATPYDAAFVVKTASAGNISGDTLPYSVQFTAQNLICMDGKPRLAGNDIVIVPVTGMVRLPDAGNYFQFDCINGEATIT